MRLPEFWSRHWNRSDIKACNTDERTAMCGVSVQETGEAKKMQGPGVISYEWCKDYIRFKLVIRFIIERLGIESRGMFLSLISFNEEEFADDVSLMVPSASVGEKEFSSKVAQWFAFSRRKTDQTINQLLGQLVWCYKFAAKADEKEAWAWFQTAFDEGTRFDDFLNWKSKVHEKLSSLKPERLTTDHTHSDKGSDGISKPPDDDVHCDVIDKVTSDVEVTAVDITPLATDAECGGNQDLAQLPETDVSCDHDDKVASEDIDEAVVDTTPLANDAECEGNQVLDQLPKTNVSYYHDDKVASGDIDEAVVDTTPLANGAECEGNQVLDQHPETNVPYGHDDKVESGDIDEAVVDTTPLATEEEYEGNLVLDQVASGDIDETVVDTTTLAADEEHEDNRLQVLTQPPEEGAYCDVMDKVTSGDTEETVFDTSPFATEEIAESNKVLAQNYIRLSGADADIDSTCGKEGDPEYPDTYDCGVDCEYPVTRPPVFADQDLPQNEISNTLSNCWTEHSKEIIAMTDVPTDSDGATVEVHILSLSSLLPFSSTESISVGGSSINSVSPDSSLPGIRLIFPVPAVNQLCDSTLLTPTGEFKLCQLNGQPLSIFRYVRNCTCDIGSA